MRYQTRFVLFGLLVTVMVLGLAFFVREFFDTKPVIGVMDTSTVLAGHAEMLKAERMIGERKRVLQAELDERISNLEGTKREELRKEYQIRLDNESQGLRNKAVSNIRKRIGEYARSKGFAYIVDSKAVLYGGVDVTRGFLDSGR